MYVVEGRRPRRIWLESVEADMTELKIDKGDVHDRKKWRWNVMEEDQPYRKINYKPIIINILDFLFLNDHASIRRFTILIDILENGRVFIQRSMHKPRKHQMTLDICSSDNVYIPAQIHHLTVAIEINYRKDLYSNMKYDVAILT